MKQQKLIQDLLNFSLIIIDKPSGPTSFSVSNYIRKTLNLSKTSHMGTLDPQVTGVLPITLGRACRLSDYFMHKDKEYVGIMCLHADVSLEELKVAAQKFVGKIEQLPPVRSSVKRALRIREVKSFEILEKTDKDVLFKTTVQAGTYIRKLIHDLGEKIGGAHMLELRRTKASIFREEETITLYEFDSLVQTMKNNDEKPIRKYLIPAEDAIKKVLPVVEIAEKNLAKIYTGKPLLKEDLTSAIPKGEIFAAFAKEKFVGVYRKVDEKDIIAKPEFVFN